MRTTAVLVGLAVVACGAARAEEPAPAPMPAPASEPAPVRVWDKDKAQGYGAIGLVATSSTLETPGLPDADAGGAGLTLRGAAHSGKVNPSLDIAFTGEIAGMARTYDDTDVDVADGLYEINGGIRISDLFFASLGIQSQSSAYDNLTTTYNIVPLGIGLLHTHERGYSLAQLKLGVGAMTNDQSNDRETLGYVGLRGFWQYGAPSGIQFMLGLGLDKYEFKDAGGSERFFRLEAGIGFGT